MQDQNVLNATAVRKLKLKELQELATKLEVSIIETMGDQTFDKKKSHLLEEVLVIVRQQQATADQTVAVTKDQQLIVDSEKSKSDKIRGLFDSGLTVSQIKRVLDVHYSFAHGVVERHVAKQKVSAEVLAELPIADEVPLKEGKVAKVVSVTQKITVSAPPKSKSSKKEAVA